MPRTHTHTPTHTLTQARRHTQVASSFMLLFITIITRRKEASVSQAAFRPLTPIIIVWVSGVYRAVTSQEARQASPALLPPRPPLSFAHSVRCTPFLSSLSLFCCICCPPPPRCVTSLSSFMYHFHAASSSSSLPRTLYLIHSVSSSSHSVTVATASSSLCSNICLQISSLSRLYSCGF